MKNKIYKYDFLIVGAGMIGCLTALSLLKKNCKTDMNDFLLKIKKYKKVIVYTIYEYWYDIGKISTLKKVNKIYKNNV